MTSKVWQCEYCQRKYKRENNYKKHILTCRLLCDSDTSEDKILPSREELYTILLALVKDQKQLREEIKQLKSVCHIRKKINYIDWLQEHRVPELSYDLWINTLVFTDTHFQIIISDTNFIRAISSVLDDLITSQTNIPYASFEKPSMCLYTYDKNKWIPCTDEHIQPLVNKIFKSLPKLLQSWEEKAQYELQRDDFEDKYAKYILRIMGPSIEVSELYRQFRKILYDIVKLNLNYIIEYEFTC
mgnify:CR=1 FL=1